MEGMELVKYFSFLVKQLVSSNATIQSLQLLSIEATGILSGQSCLVGKLDD